MQRQLCFGDLPKIRVLAQSVGITTYQRDEKYVGQTAKSWGEYEEEELIGYVTMWNSGATMNPHFILASVAVHPSRQGQGIGMLLSRRSR